MFHLPSHNVGDSEDRDSTHGATALTGLPGSQGDGGMRDLFLARVRDGAVVDSHGRRWQERANCLGVDPDLFFPERGASTREAKSVCAACDVRAECLEYALVNGEKFGIWGGLSERERRRLRRQRAMARRAAASA